MTRIPASAKALLIGIIVVYVALGAVLVTLVHNGVLERSAPTPIGQTGNDSVEELPPPLDIPIHLQAAQGFVYEHLARENGHVDLYWMADPKAAYPGANSTNSEAASYYLLWTAQAGDKAAFDNELAFVKAHMQHPDTGHLYWRLEANDSAITDGTNIASDADLRAIKALRVAQARWSEPQYRAMIDALAKGLETVAITDDNYLAPYGNGPIDNPWRAKEVWLSYAEFTVFGALAKERGEPWVTLDKKMRNASLGAQIHNGLFNSELTESRQYGNGIDGGVYSINSMWTMIRMAESGDPQLRAAANRSLDFYRSKYRIDGQLFATYGSNGDALSPDDTPWVYALVGRAAAALDDREFADAMMKKLVGKQVMDIDSPLNGGFPEGAGRDRRVGQFTMQESILAMQEYLAMQDRLAQKGEVKDGQMPAWWFGR